MALCGCPEGVENDRGGDPTPPSKRKIIHGRTVADPLESYWDNDLLPLLEKDSTLQAVTLLRIFRASIHWRSPIIVSGAR